MPFTADDVGPDKQTSEGLVTMTLAEKEEMAAEWSANEQLNAAQRLSDEREAKIKAEMEAIQRREAITALTGRGEI